MRIAALIAIAVPVVAVVAVLLVAARYGGVGALLESKYRVTAVLDDATGLIPGGEVRAGGIQVGRIEQLALGADGYPRATLEIGKSYRIRSGAKAAVDTPGPGSATSGFVELLPGRGVEVPDGAVIPRSRTHTVVQLDHVLSTLDPHTRTEVKAFFRRFDRATAGRGADVDRALRHSATALGRTADIAAQLGADGPALRTLVAKGREVVDAIDASPGSLGGFADRLSALLRTTAARQVELDATVKRTASGLSAGRGALQRLDASIPTLRGLVAEARPGVRELRSIAPELRATFAHARPALRELDALVRTGPAQLEQIRPLLRTARPVFDEGAPALRDSSPILNQLRVRFPDAFAFFSNWADFAANYDANGHVARMGLFFSGTNRNAIGPADTGPGRLKRPYLRDPGTSDGDPWTTFEHSFVGAK